MGPSAHPQRLNVLYIPFSTVTPEIIKGTPHVDEGFKPAPDNPTK
jgi:hypothetical protein